MLLKNLLPVVDGRENCSVGETGEAVDEHRRSEAQEKQGIVHG